MLDDVRTAGRQLRRRPGFGVPTVLTIALSVGASVAVFALADPLLIRPLPYPDGNRIVIVAVQATGDGYFDGMVQVADFLRAETNHTGFSSIGAFYNVGVGHVEGLADRVSAVAVTRTFLDVLQIQPVLGGKFLPEEYAVRDSQVALITHRLWQQSFGGHRDVVGQTLRLMGTRPRAFRIVGVLPPDFLFPNVRSAPPDVLVPGALDVGAQSDRRARTNMFARLKTGESLEAAQAKMQVIAANVELEHPAFPQRRKIQLQPLREALFGRVRATIVMLFAVTGCAVLLACGNLGHLLMAHLRAREHEFAVRCAIGASPRDIVRLLSVEILALGVIGWVGSLVVGQWVRTAVLALIPDNAFVYHVLPDEFNLRVSAFAALLVLACTVLVTAGPIGLAARRSGHAHLQSGQSRGGSRSGGGDRVLILLQSAFVVTVLVTAVLIVRSYLGLVLQPVGFAPEGARLVLPEVPGHYWTGDRSRVKLFRRLAEVKLRERLGVPVGAAGAGLPGIMSAGFVRRADQTSAQRIVQAWEISAGGFEVFGVDLLKGRFFAEEEAFDDSPVVVIDRRAEELLWPGGNALGQRLVDERDVARTVVGVVKTLRLDLTGEKFERGGAFLPLPAQPISLNLLYRDDQANIPIERVREILQEVEPNAFVVVRPYRPFEAQLGEPRFRAAVVGTAGTLAIVLALLGMYSIVSHEAVRRLHEVGIRLVLGAKPEGIRSMLVLGALAPAAVGVSAGLIACVWWTQSLRALLHGIQPDDPVTFVGCGIGVLATVIGASVIPAWRVSDADPSVALRAE